MTELDFSNKALEKRIDFLQVRIDYDKNIAIRRYTEEYEQNLDQMKDCHISFNQWLTERKIEALSYEISSI